MLVKVCLWNSLAMLVCCGEGPGFAEEVLGIGTPDAGRNLMSHSTRQPRPALPTVWLIAAMTAACAPAVADQPPNIILCMGDDHGWEETAYNGHPHVRTPVLDEMAAAGLRLDRFYSAAPVCSPTRGSVLTGRHPNRYGTFAPNWSMRPEEITIAQILRKAGYIGGHFGKWHVGAVKTVSPLNPKAMGFEEYLSHDNFFEMDPYLSRNGGPPEKLEGESSQILVDEAIRFIRKAGEAKRPFFVVIWFGSPHEPYVGTDKDLTLYDDLPELDGDRSVTLTGLDTGLPVARPLGEVLRERYAEITAMDRAIGSLRRYLDEAGLRRRTLLWYCGDNGIPASGGRLATPFRGQKGALYEGGVRVPGIIEWPERISEPRATDVNAVTSDILPTLCELVGQPLPDRPIDGISLKAVIDSEMMERPEPICFWTYDTSGERRHQTYLDPTLQRGTTPLVKNMDGLFTRDFLNFHHPAIAEADFAGARAVLDGRYKLVIHDRSGKDPLRELFDLREDRTESVNLIESRPELAGKLEQHLRAWQRSVLESLTGADYSSPKTGDEG